MLGKRSRSETKRRASMSEVTFNRKAIKVDAETPPPKDQLRRGRCDLKKTNSAGTTRQSPQVADSSGELLDQWLLTTYLSPPTNLCRRQSVYSLTSHFLQSCRLCMGRLVPGRDIYMYRGDNAFCSQECRQQQMSQDERKEKRLAEKLSPSNSSSSATETTVAETVATV